MSRLVMVVAFLAMCGCFWMACYTGQGPRTVCNPADFGCTQPFGMPVVDGGAG